MQTRRRPAMLVGLALAALAATASACLVPTGIDDGATGSLTTADLATLPEDNIFAACIQIATSSNPGLGSYETPIQFRLIQHAASSIYGTAAAFHPTALDLYGRVGVSEDRRRCNTTDADLLAKHRRVTLAYATAWGMARFIPEIKPQLTQLLAAWGLDIERCPGAAGCSNPSTPWGLAQLLVDDAAEFASRDGWNSDGSMNAEFNRVPYQDPRQEPYTPVNSPWFLSRKRRYQPLLESDSRGFFFHQEVVTPHIGFTARSILLRDDDICERRAPRPRYNLRHESEQALDRTAQLNDRTKAEVEFFDSKLTSIVPLQVQYFARQGVSLDSFEFIKADLAVIAALYEGVITVWREKVRHDKVRPTSIIHHLKRGETVFSYGGPAVGGATNLPGDQWQPYIRVMPHQEYPSGSSCVCSAFARVMQALTGTDDVTAALGGAPLAAQVPANSSRIETNQPAQEQVFTYSAWSEIADRCGVSRLNGGMHFTASIKAGEDLCADIGDIAVAAFNKLEAGERPDYIVDFDAPQQVTDDRCSDCW